MYIIFSSLSVIIYSSSYVTFIKLFSPPDIIKPWEFGAYSVKATVEARDELGELDKTFIGYSQNMDITERTAKACNRYKTSGTKCGEPVMVIKGGECDEVIFMKIKNSTNLIRLLSSP